MAEKILNTRIQLKNATLAQWNASTLVLKAGEVALAKIDTTTTDELGQRVTIPTYLMKVGDGTKTFSQLNWMAAPASDVYAWAKKASLDLNDIPVMDAAHIPTLEISKISGLGDKLSALETAVGTGGSVDTKIKNAIEALDVDASTDESGIVISSISETDGKISVTRRALVKSDIPTIDISQVDKLEGRLTGIEGKLTGADTVDGSVANKIKTEIEKLDVTDAAVDHQFVTAVAEEDGKISVSRAALVADDIPELAQSKITGLEDALGARVLKTTYDTKMSELDTAIANEKKAREDADKGINDELAQLKTNIGNLSNIMNFRGAVASKDAITDPVSGDVIAVTEGADAGKEFVYDGTAWVEFGYVDAASTAISGLQDRMTAAEGKLNVIQGEGEGSIKKALADAKSYADQAEADAVSAVKGTASDASSAETVAGAKKYADEKVKALADGAVATNTSNISALTTRVSTAESKLTTLTGADTVEGSVAKALKDAKAYADSQDSALKTSLEGNASTATANDTTIEGAKKYAAAAVKALEDGQVKTNKTDIANHDTRLTTIEGKYVSVSGENLVTASGDVIVFDCGGAE